jgi:hypothetical protein
MMLALPHTLNSNMESWKRRARRLVLSFLYLNVLTTTCANAVMWPFGPKRFKSNSLITAGSLGLEGFDGRIAAFGDFNGDQLYIRSCLS